MPTITTVDATWDTGVTLDASELRRADTTMFAGDGSANGVRGGIVRHGPTSLAVSVNGSDQVAVQAGAAVIPAATGLGVYRCSLATATSAVGIAARNATNPRIDLVVMQATGTNVTVKTIEGTPGASPSAPALPAQHIELARLAVPATGGGAVTVESSWRAYAAAPGGTIPVDTQARLPGSGTHPGQRAVALDTGVEYAWDGAVWRPALNPGQWASYVVTVTPETGAFSDATGVGRYTVIGRTMIFEITATITNAGTGAGGVRLGVPLPMAGAFLTAVAHGRESAATGVALLGYIQTATLINVQRYDNTSVIASGRTLRIAGTCELA